MPDGHMTFSPALVVVRCIPDHLREMLDGAPAHVLALLDQTFEQKCSENAWTGFVCGMPVFAAGIIVHWDGTGRDGHPSGLGEAWAVSGHVPVPRRLWPDITRRVRAGIDAALRTRLTLVECTVKTDYAAGHRWARRLGFIETGPRPGWSPEGDDGVLYHRSRGNA